MHARTTSYAPNPMCETTCNGIFLDDRIKRAAELDRLIAVTPMSQRTAMVTSFDCDGSYGEKNGTIRAFSFLLTIVFVSLELQFKGTQHNPFEWIDDPGLREVWERLH